jgi:hypothetical protein
MVVSTLACPSNSCAVRMRIDLSIADRKTGQADQSPGSAAAD